MANRKYIGSIHILTVIGMITKDLIQQFLDQSSFDCGNLKEARNLLGLNLVLSVHMGIHISISKKEIDLDIVVPN